MLVLTNLAGSGFGPVSMAVPPGTCIGIRGPSGSGKSRLLRAIADLDPHRGSVRLDGVAAADLPAPEWRRRVGLLPPESQWWYERAGDHFRRQDTPLVTRLGLPPEVYGWSVARMSSGERQRLALARLLENTPQVLLLDEPTANLDPDNTARAEAVVAEYLRARVASVLWVSHDQAQLERVATRILLMPEGRWR
jgi:ABC-type iron transport system FetAB ATPase subunit